jgi:hypothetical protein
VVAIGLGFADPEFADQATARQRVMHQNSLSLRRSRISP